MKLLEKYRKKSRTPQALTKKMLMRYIKFLIAFTLFSLIMTINALCDPTISSLSFSLLVVTIALLCFFGFCAGLSLRIRKLEEKAELANQKRSVRSENASR